MIKKIVKSKIFIILGAIMLLIAVWTVLWLINYNNVVKPVLNNPNYKLILEEKGPVQSNYIYNYPKKIMVEGERFSIEVFCSKYPRISSPRIVFQQVINITDEDIANGIISLELPLLTGYIRHNEYTGKLEQIRVNLSIEKYKQDFIFDMDGNLLNENELLKSDLDEYEKNQKLIKAVFEKSKELFVLD